MKVNYNKIAALVAAIIGSMAVFSGIKVLLGIDPGYYVINWLPVYNYTMGILTVFVTARLLWINSKLAMPVAITTLTMHGLVMLSLQTFYRYEVAYESIQAMTVRVITWVIILGIMVIQSHQKKEVQKMTKLA